MTSPSIFPLPNTPDEVQWPDEAQDMVDALNKIDPDSAFQIKLSPNNVIDLLRFGFYISHAVRLDMNYSAALKDGDVDAAVDIGKKAFASLKMADISMRSFSSALYKSIIDGAQHE